MKIIKRNKTVVLAMIGAINGLMISIVFSQYPNMIAAAPICTIVGGLIGSRIDNRNQENDKRI